MPTEPIKSTEGNGEGEERDAPETPNHRRHRKEKSTVGTRTAMNPPHDLTPEMIAKIRYNEPH